MILFLWSPNTSFHIKQLLIFAYNMCSHRVLDSHIALHCLLNHFPPFWGENSDLEDSEIILTIHFPTGQSELHSFAF